MSGASPASTNTFFSSCCILKKKNIELTIIIIIIIRIQVRRDFLYRLIEKYFEQLIDSVWVLWPHCRNFKANDFKHHCATACASTCQAHMRCTSAIDESVHQIWRNRFVYSWVLTLSIWSRSVSLNESSIVFVCFGRVISQNLFRNFTFEISDYFKCHSNGSSRPHLNQMLEFSLNCPTTNNDNNEYNNNNNNN